MLKLIAEVRDRVLQTYGIALENEVILWADEAREIFAKTPEVIAQP